MTKISVTLSLFVFLATFTLAMEGKQKSPGIYLTMESETWIKGEPIYIQVEKLGVRWDGGYYLDGEPCKQYGVPMVRHAPLVNPDGSPATSGGPSEEYFLQDETLTLDITHLCSWRMKDMKTGSHELCYKRDKGDLCVTFRVDEPQGVDAEAWKEISKDYPNVLDAIQAQKHITRDELLARFPTSTYAGWVLKSISPGAIMGYSTTQEMLEDLKKPFKERKGRKGQGGHDPKGKPIWITPEEEAQKYIDLAELFLKTHEDHVVTPIVSLRLALAYFVLHRWQEGYDTLKKSISKPWPGWHFAREDNKDHHRKIAEEILEVLPQRGLAKDKD